MHTPTLALALGALTNIARAQTFSDCDPTAGDKCEPNPAFANCNKATTFDFSSLPHGDSAWKDDDKFNDFWEAAKSVSGKQLSIDDDGMALRIDNEKESGPLIMSNKYLFYGSVEVEVKAAPGVGVVTSIVLESNDRDEIDWVSSGSLCTATWKRNHGGKRGNETRGTEVLTATGMARRRPRQRPVQLLLQGRKRVRQRRHPPPLLQRPRGPPQVRHRLDARLHRVPRRRPGGAPRDARGPQEVAPDAHAG